MPLNKETKPIPHLFVYHEWLKDMLSNSNSFISTQLNGFKHREVRVTIKYQFFLLHTGRWLNSSIWSMDGIQKNTTTPGQSQLGNMLWRDTLHFQGDWRLTIRGFRFASRSLLGGGVPAPLQRCIQYILQSLPIGLLSRGYSRRVLCPGNKVKIPRSRKRQNKLAKGSYNESIFVQNCILFWCFFYSETSV